MQAAGRGPEAERCYLSVLSDHPTNFDALMLIGYLRLEQNDPAQALASFAKAVEAAPDDARTYAGVGEAAILMGRLVDAAEAFSDAVRLDPDNAGARNNLASALSRLGRLEDAVAQYRAAADLMPSNTMVMMNLGKCLQELDRIDEAISVYRDVLKIDPSLFYRVSLRLTAASSGRFWHKVDDLRSALGLE